MTYTVSSGTLNPTQQLNPYVQVCSLMLCLWCICGTSTINISVFRGNISVDAVLWFQLSSVIAVKPFNLAALKVGDLACKIILAPFILAN